MGNINKLIEKLLDKLCGFSVGHGFLFLQTLSHCLMRVFYPPQTSHVLARSPPAPHPHPLNSFLPSPLGSQCSLCSGASWLTGAFWSGQEESPTSSVFIQSSIALLAQGAVPGAGDSAVVGGCSLSYQTEHLVAQSQIRALT